MYRKYKAGYMNNNSIKYNKTTNSQIPIISEFINIDKSSTINQKQIKIILVSKKGNLENIIK